MPSCWECSFMESSCSSRHTCLRLEIKDEQTLDVIFIKGTWFQSHFNLSITNGLNTWICNASEDDVKERAKQWDQSVSEYIDTAERYLGFRQPGSSYAFMNAGNGFKRLSWTFEKQGTKLEWRWKCKASLDDKRTTTEVVDFLMDANIRLSEEVVRKTQSFERLKMEAGKCLEQSEKFKNEKVEFESAIYAKFVGVLNSKKAKLRELRDQLSKQESTGKLPQEEGYESTDKTESYDDKSEEEPQNAKNLPGTSKNVPATKPYTRKRKTFNATVTYLIKMPNDIAVLEKHSMDATEGDFDEQYITNNGNGDSHPQEQEEHGDDSGAEGEKRWPGWPGESVFRLLVPIHKVGGIIGRKGELIKKMCEETRARIKILDAPPGTQHRAVLISAREEPDTPIPPAIDGLLRIQKRMIDDLDDELANGPPNPGSMSSSRLLLGATQAGFLIGKQGTTIKSIQEASNAIVRVLGPEELPVFALEDDRIVEIAGEPSGMHKALELVASTLRKFLVDRSVIGLFEKQMQMQMQMPHANMERNMPSHQSWGPPQGFPPNGGEGPGFGMNPQYMPPPRHDNYYPPADLGPPRDKQPHRGLSMYGRDAPMGVHLSMNAPPPPPSSQVTQHMQVPLSYADAVIGTAGANISYIRRASGATVTIQETRGVPGEMTVEINGSASQVQAAQQLIQNCMVDPTPTAQNPIGGSMDTNYNSYPPAQADTNYNLYPPAQADANYNSYPPAQADASYNSYPPTQADANFSSYPQSQAPVYTSPPSNTGHPGQAAPAPGYGGPVYGNNYGY
ncbi:hypothetical protein GIB67_027161 [Kingdonia uniflora]|uniref:K Homology domain-containing protein n=1 Tax=Kingdonia uniflora TaxID=39325 RepID=A0A7J7P1Z9_9MAGN|nr:hypothetical protein GIB67_027161 [Kingdonia uniflora]